MNYFLDFLRNLAVMGLVFIGALVFMKIFYPDTIQLFKDMAELYSILKLWPLLIVGLIVYALPRRRRRD